MQGVLLLVYRINPGPSGIVGELFSAQLCRFEEQLVFNTRFKIVGVARNWNKDISVLFDLYLGPTV